MTTYVALLYSIGVAEPGRRVVMADLKAMAAALGCREARTVASTGNLIFEAEETPLAEIEAKLEDAFEKRFGRRVAIILREGRAWRRLARGNPFLRESAQQGDRVIVRVGREQLGKTIEAALTPHLAMGERIQAVGGDLWAYFPGEPAQSRLLRALTPKKLGGAGTLRNWNTVRRIEEML
ncbi:MAG TPA: DUF1697 domain-containing protein [Roseiarcus sp.]|nr:DUF1697 domain-containing protein [Roseiarcus sp.]